jgi:integrase
MATIVARKRKDGTTGFKVQWRLGGTRDGAWQSETFENSRAAAKFQSRVEANGHLWPEGWVKGRGFVALAPGLGEEQSLREFGSAYVRRLTSTGPYTQTRYLQQVSALADWFQTLKGEEPTLQNITMDDDQEWINARRRAGASPKTIANNHGLLAAIFKSAVRKGIIARNPCEGVKLPRIDDDHDNDEEKIFLTEAEFALVHREIDLDSRDLLAVAVGTGLRWGELTALKPGDLNLDAVVPTLAVRRAWKWNGSGEFAIEGQGRFYLGSPKTKESRRRITLAPSVVAAFRRQLQRNPGEFVFGRPGGSPLKQSQWYDARWRRAVAKAQQDGLTKEPRFHDLRHTHAAWLISAGVPLPVVQKRLGHKSIQITVDVYGGLLFQTHQVADLAIERALGGEQIVTVVSDATADLEAATALPEQDIA